MMRQVRQPNCYRSWTRLKRRAYLPLTRAVNPAARFVGISLNTSSMPESEAFATIARTAEKTGLACFDPIRTGVGAVVDVLADFPEATKI